ncbi:MAG: class I SAM-dependent RNA methyltransferase, partial [Bacilli bacterium]|nr:class I SAM-dependent RNA methyltransferase [Bacilli bacterium]
MKVKIEKFDHFGRGITYINDKIAFIENALPQEIVEIKITKENKKYLEGKVIEIIEKSPIRIEEECPYSKICGGCQLNHICYNEENKYKEEKVKEIINHTLKEDINIKKISYHDRNNYRNKITLHGKDGVIGLYQEKTNEIIPIKSCILVNPKINEIIQVLENSKHNIEKVTIKTSNNNRE